MKENKHENKYLIKKMEYNSWEDLPIIAIHNGMKNKTITTFTLILTSLSTKRMVYIRRKHSPCFLLFFNGCYGINNIPHMIDNITNDEKEILNSLLDNLLHDEFNVIVYNMYNNINKKKLDYGYYQMTQMKDMIYDVLNNNSEISNDLEYLWPKGHKYYNETKINAAIREFTEEISYDLYQYDIVENVSEDHISQINHNELFISDRSYYYCYSGMGNMLFKTICFAGFVIDEFEIDETDNDYEISDRKWISYDDAYEILDDKKRVVLNKIYLLLS